jgi:hypothetical protein
MTQIANSNPTLTALLPMLLEQRLGRPPTEAELQQIQSAMAGPSVSTSTSANAIGPAPEPEPEEDKTGFAGLAQDVGGLFKRDDALGFRLLETLGNLGSGFAQSRAIKDANEQTAQSNARANLINALSRRNVARGTRAEPKMGLLGQLSQGVSAAGRVGRDVGDFRRSEEQRKLANELAKRKAAATEDRTAAMREGHLMTLLGKAGRTAKLPPALTTPQVDAYTRDIRAYLSKPENEGKTAEQAAVALNIPWMQFRPTDQALIDSRVRTPKKRPNMTDTAFDEQWNAIQAADGNTIEEQAKNAGVDISSWSDGDQDRLAARGQSFEAKGRGTFTTGEMSLLKDIGRKNPDGDVEALVRTLAPFVNANELYDAMGFVFKGRHDALKESATRRGKAAGDKAARDKAERNASFSEYNFFLNELERGWDNAFFTGTFFRVLDFLLGPDAEDASGAPLFSQGSMARRLAEDSADLADQLTNFSLRIVKELQGTRASELDLKAAMRALPLQGDSDDLAKRKFARLRMAVDIKRAEMEYGEENDTPLITGFNADGSLKFADGREEILNRVPAKRKPGEGNEGGGDGGGGDGDGDEGEPDTDLSGLIFGDDELWGTRKIPIANELETERSGQTQQSAANDTLSGQEVGTSGRVPVFDFTGRTGNGTQEEAEPDTLIKKIGRNLNGGQQSRNDIRDGRREALARARSQNRLQKQARNRRNRLRNFGSRDGLIHRIGRNLNDQELGTVGRPGLGSANGSRRIPIDDFTTGTRTGRPEDTIPRTTAVRAEIEDLMKPGGGAPDWMRRAFDPDSSWLDAGEGRGKSIRAASAEVDGRVILFPTIRTLDEVLGDYPKEFEKRAIDGSAFVEFPVDQAIDQAIKQGDFLEFDSDDKATEFSKKLTDLLGEKLQIQTQDRNDTGFSPDRVGDAERFASFERTQKYQPLIDHYAEQHNVDPALIAAVIVAESGGDPNAESSAGATGLMQLMPGTADSLGVTDRLSPEQNIEGGTKYLAMLIDRYDGDLNKVLAAYNAGPTAVTNNQLPQETQKYVPKVLALLESFQNQGN